MQKNLNKWGLFGIAIVVAVSGFIVSYSIFHRTTGDKNSPIDPQSDSERSFDDGRSDISFFGVVSAIQDQSLTVTSPKKMKVPIPQPSPDDKNDVVEMENSMTTVMTQETTYENTAQADLRVGDIVSLIARPSNANPSVLVLLSVRKEENGQVLLTPTPPIKSDSDSSLKELPDSMPTDVDFSRK